MDQDPVRSRSASEFDRMPPIHKIDNYDSCFQEPSDVYCKLIFQLVSDEPSELLSMIQLYSSPFYQLIINGTIMMQSFFVMAGFQLAYQLCVISKHYPLDWSIVPKIICKRLLRSIAADMQLYVFGVILMILLRDSRFRKPILTSLVVLGSVIVAIHTETGHFFATDRSYNEIYRVGHGHVSGYVIGMSLGYYIYEWQQKKNDHRKYSHKLKFLYWSIVPMIAAVVLFGAVFYRDAPRDPAYVRAICAALNKPILAGLIALFIAGLFMKVENVYRRFFELDVWVIPSKLIYSAYLLHFPLFYIFINMQTDLIRITYLDLTAIAIVVTIISFVLAIPLYLFVEAPFSSILNGSKLQQKETATKQNGSNGITKKKK
ncbi:regulator of hypoxia-inducible factor 1-like [Melitaea cinxia]|uniref:regulator of hypoxia-inducible factor 1-like n=1 Tax=Melitaea cinxia TaxID=113334 RepID=UPI001E271CD7|nr:regulator of hypoxia-inducible factor 1-like [Melitaea cinxia]